MADLLTIGGNALRTNQSALAVISNNIANVNTEGYVRQELDVSENLPSKRRLTSSKFSLGSLAASAFNWLIVTAFKESTLIAGPY